MSATVELLSAWLKSQEDEHLEFKEAKERFDFEELVQYCAALANEGGGSIILGVSDKKPRKVVGTKAFANLERTKAGLVERLRLRIDAESLDHPLGRVLVFKAPPRPIGTPIQYKGAYWMRGGEALVPMTPDVLQRIFAEAQPDFSAEVCPRATVEDLEISAIQRMRAVWHRHSRNDSLLSLTDAQLLEDAELMTDGAVTYAALILLGTRRGLGRHLAQAEVILEYRTSDASVPYQQRTEYREGFFLFQEALWQGINLRNDLHHYQDGLFVWEIPTFNESVVREAVLNAVSHRDYRLPGSIFVRQFPSKLEIVSPGGFPPGITVENILWRQSPRNRRIAEVFSKCGLVERSGQGANRMFEECVKESKPLPDYSGTDDYQVFLTLRGEVRDERFLRFLEAIGKQTLASFTTADLVVLDLVHREQTIPAQFKDVPRRLLDRGVLERVSRGKFILSGRYYSFIGEKGVYTRKRGLDRDTNKALLFKHIRDNRTSGSQLSELMQVLPSLTRSQVQSLLRDLKSEGSVRKEGRTKGARWYSGPNSEGIASEARSKAKKGNK